MAHTGRLKILWPSSPAEYSNEQIAKLIRGGLTAFEIGSTIWSDSQKNYSFPAMFGQEPVQLICKFLNVFLVEG